MLVMVMHELHTRRTVMQSVVRNVQPRILHIEPGVALSVMLQIVLDGEVPFKVQRVAIAADATRVVGVNVLFDMRKQDGGIGVENF